jgi:hypothetical protein
MDLKCAAVSLCELISYVPNILGQWSSRYATSRKILSSRPDELNAFF